MSKDAKEKKKTDWAGEARSIFWLILAVLGVHSLVAKPFYIPSESMMPALLTGDRLVVTKYPYGWSYISASFHILPFMPGRLFGSLPERGDIVIVTPPGGRQDYIKRAIGLPGDRLELRGGVLVLNGRPVPRVSVAPVRVPVDINAPCGDGEYPGARRETANGGAVCELPAFRETLPGGKSYLVTDTGYSPGDDFGPVTIPANHVFVMGDNRDHSADSRYPLAAQGLGGAIPWENIGGRAEVVTFSLDGSGSWINPISWVQALRGGRAGTTLRAETEG